MKEKVERILNTKKELKNPKNQIKQQQIKKLILYNFLGK